MCNWLREETWSRLADFSPLEKFRQRVKFNFKNEETYVIPRIWKDLRKIARFVYLVQIGSQKYRRIFFLKLAYPVIAKFGYIIFL